MPSVAQASQLMNSLSVTCDVHHLPSVKGLTNVDLLENLSVIPQGSGCQVVYMQDEEMENLHTGQVALAFYACHYMHTYITFNCLQTDFRVAYAASFSEHLTIR